MQILWLDEVTISNKDSGFKPVYGEYANMSRVCKVTVSDPADSTPDVMHKASQSPHPAQGILVSPYYPFYPHTAKIARENSSMLGSMQRTQPVKQMTH